MTWERHRGEAFQVLAICHFLPGSWLHEWFLDIHFSAFLALFCVFHT